MSPIYGQAARAERILSDAMEGNYGLELSVKSECPLEWEAGSTFDAILRYFCEGNTYLPPELPDLQLVFEAGETLEIVDNDCCSGEISKLVSSSDYLTQYPAYRPGIPTKGCFSPQRLGSVRTKLKWDTRDPANRFALAFISFTLPKQKPSSTKLDRPIGLSKKMAKLNIAYKIWVINYNAIF